MSKQIVYSNCCQPVQSTAPCVALLPTLCGTRLRDEGHLLNTGWVCKCRTEGEIMPWYGMNSINIKLCAILIQYAIDT